MFLLALLVGLSSYVASVSEDAPSSVAPYESALASRVYAGDGEVLDVLAREERFHLTFDAFPPHLVAAATSSEDKNFFEHSGVDYVSLVAALAENFVATISGDPSSPRGASTITQQVAKALYLSPEQSLERKVAEALIAFQLEQEFSKEEILEIYLNESYFGLGAYGIVSAAQSYFDAPVQQLSVAQIAYLIGLLKGPSNYHPVRNPDAAIERRNLVIGQMLENGYLTTSEAEAASAEPLGFVGGNEGPRVFDYASMRNSAWFEENYAEVLLRDGGIPVSVASHFNEEVRRSLIEELGADMLYEGGLSVRTSLDPELQIIARSALIDALTAYDERQGWRGPVATIDVGEDWRDDLRRLRDLEDVVEWSLAVVLEVTGFGAEIGVDGGAVGTIPNENMSWAGGGAVSVGDVVYVEPVGGDGYRLRQPPQLEGAVVVMEPSGRVLAMVGGFSFAESEFNRATQALRQPGSSFKPFVYAAALANGYTPASIVVDAPIEIFDETIGEMWRPTNYSEQFYGPLTLRTGVELSRNVMTVQLAQDIGMPLVSHYAEKFGIYDQLDPYLAMSLGSGETTLLRLTAAYATLANGGHAVEPSLIDLAQDRSGQTIIRNTSVLCPSCNVDQWIGQDEPILVEARERVISEEVAYQVTSILRGVVERGTATVVSSVDHPIAGKTGTTNDYRDAWFVGYSTELVVGAYIGFDAPRSLGVGMTGGTLAAPIVRDIFAVALENQPPRDFPVPENLVLVPINQDTGELAHGASQGVIMEAFVRGTEPLR